MDALITLLPGDGIGPEVTAAAHRTLKKVAEVYGHSFTFEVRLIGATSNRDAVGARVSINAGGRVQMRERAGGGSYLAGNDPRLHFGLGDAERVDLIEVRWPSGVRDRLMRVEADRQITIREGQGLVE